MDVKIPTLEEIRQMTDECMDHILKAEEKLASAKLSMYELKQLLRLYSINQKHGEDKQ